MNENVLHELPGSWLWTRLGEIVDDVKKVNPKETPDKEFIYLDIASIDNSQQKITNPKKYIGENAPSRARQLVKTEDILFSSVRTYLKNISIVNEIYDNQIASTGFCVIRPYNPINKRLIFYFVQTDFFLNPLTQIQRGTSYPAVRDSDVFDQIVPLPPLPEQRRIVTKLEELFTRLDAGVSELKKTQAQLKRYRQSVLKAACEGKLVPTEAELAKAEGRAYEPADVLLARISKERRAVWDKNGKGAKHKESAAPDTNGLPLPKGWSWTNVGQMTDSMKNGIYKPSEFYNEDGFACLRMYNIDGGKIVWKDIKRMNLSKEEIDEFLLIPGDLLVNRVNSRELVGKAAVIPPGIERCVFESKNIRVRVLDEIVNPYYLCYRFTSVGTEYFNRNAQQVVGMASISQPQISRFPVPLPPLAEQRRIVAEVERRLSVADEVARTVEQSLTQAKRLRQSILKKAFEGRLVAQDERDEPAGVLMERIKAEKGRIGEKKRKR